MKNILYSILLGFAILGVGCDDSEKELPFAVSTDTWTFPAEGGTQNLIVSAPGAWEVSQNPEWCTLTPKQAEGPREVKIECTENDGNERTGSMLLTCGTETLTIAISQEAASGEDGGSDD